eukprot:scaffold90482_cov52-Attheya_sp.AAC.7
MGRRDDHIPLEVELYQAVLISDKSKSLEGDSKDNDRCMADHMDFMRNLQMEKERVDNCNILETDFLSSLASIAIDDLGTIFENDDHEDSGIKSANSPAASAEVCHDKFLQTVSDVDTNGQKTKLTPSMSPNVEINDKLGPSVEARRPPYRRILSNSSLSIPTDDIDSSQSSMSSRSSSHSLFSKQSFAEPRLTTRMRSSSSGDLSKYKHASKLSSLKRQMFGRRSSLPGVCTPNSTWDYVDPSKSVLEPSPMLELLRKKSLKETKTANAASRMIEGINEAEAMAAAIAKNKTKEDHETNKEREAQKKHQSNSFFRPVVTIDEPDDDGALSMGSDDLSVSLGRSTELDFSQSYRCFVRSDTYRRCVDQASNTQAPAM